VKKIKQLLRICILLKTMDHGHLSEFPGKDGKVQIIHLLVSLHKTETTKHKHRTRIECKVARSAEGLCHGKRWTFSTPNVMLLLVI